MNGYFVTGTDTGIGKTLVSAILTLALKGYYWKPVQSSLVTGLSDTQAVQGLTELSDSHFFPSTYALQADLSPNQAAQLENISIELSRCHLTAPRCPLIVEGAGGVYVPLNDKQTILDLMLQLALPIIIVARGTLGTINHTLLTIDVLRAHGLTVQGIVYSGELKPANAQNITALSHVPTLFHVPYLTPITPQTLQRWVKQHRLAILGGLSCR